MAKIKFEIDTDDSSHGNAKILTGTKVGFLSSIPPEQILLTAFIVGTGLAGSDLETPAYGATFKYDKTTLKNKGDGLKNNCGVIATVGGGITIDAQDKTNARFVSLVGTPPPANSTIVGGVSLDSIKLDAFRKNYLKGLSGGNVYTDANIFLYMNSNSLMNGAEAGAWGNNTTGKNSAAGQNGGVNDPASFAADFAQGGPLDTAKGLIISDDPFFRGARGELIKQINAWLGRDATRRVVYPSQMYGSPALNDLSGNPQAPKSGQSILYGPDLIEAYRLLGTIARCSHDNPSAMIGFISATPFIVTF